jgi:hypothetical protein
MIESILTPKFCVMVLKLQRNEKSFKHIASDLQLTKSLDYLLSRFKKKFKLHMSCAHSINQLGFIVLEDRIGDRVTA